MLEVEDEWTVGVLVDELVTDVLLPGVEEGWTVGVLVDELVV